MIIAVDFDGTCVDHRFPAIGADVPGAVDWLKAFKEAGASLILWTMRSDEQLGPTDELTVLAEAVAWFAEREIALFGVNGNAQQSSWSTSPKVYAHIYIDDAAFGCPLRQNPRAGGRPYVDWSIVGPAVLAQIQETFPCRSASSTGS